MKKRFIFICMAAALLLSAALSACAPAAQPPAPKAETATLKIAVLPILDALPMYVAQKEGLFEKQGVKVEFVPVASAPERDQIIAAGQADGMINEALSTALYNQNKTQVQTVRFARAATADSPLFSILASGKSGITAAEGLKGTPVGISQGTVIEYLTDRLLQAKGFAKEDIQTIAVPKIPDRVNLLNTGELKAAMLPEPATSLAIQQGSQVVLDDTLRPELSFSTITFRKPIIDEKSQAVRAFLAAIEQAVGMINADPAKYVPLLVEQKIVPPPLANSFKVPAFVTAGVPSQAQWQDMLAWAKEKGILKQDVSYSESVNPGLLP